jgi:hypothetical protein
MMGSNAWRRLDSSPTNISRLISNPTLKKKIVISTSLMKVIKIMGCP